MTRKGQFDVIHAHDWLTYMAGIAAKRLTGKPLVVHVHATSFDRSSDQNIDTRVYEIEKKGMEAADRVITVSDLTRNIVITKYGINPDKVVTVHNAVDFSGRSEMKVERGVDDKVVTFLGRITFQKGPEYFIEAAAKVLKRCPGVRFVMAGSGDMMNRSIRQVARLGISDRFHFTGFLRGTDVQNLKNSFASFWKYRYLLQNLITRDFKLKYRRSVLGVAWSVLNPLLTCLVMWAVFGALFNQRGDGIEDFPLFLIIGQLMFNFFRESTSMAMESVLKNGPLLRKVYIPKYIFPLEKCCFALVNFFFSLVALFFVALVTWSHISLRTVLLAVYPIVMLFVFSLGVGLILSTMYVFVRDIMHIWEVFCTLLVYGSAIFYDPSQMASWMQAVINLNPIYWYLTAVRSCVMWGTGLTLNLVLIPFLCSALSLGIGVYVFKKNQDKFVLYM